jgi:galactose mutarotase-like enzyme
VGTGDCRKLYVDPETPIDQARLVRPDGSALALRWSDGAPYLGIWFDGGAYSAEPVIAIEPSTGYYDSLERAIRHGRVPTLQPGRPFTWWVELDFLPDSPHM